MIDKSTRLSDLSELLILTSNNKTDLEGGNDQMLRLVSWMTIVTHVHFKV